LAVPKRHAWPAVGWLRLEEHLAVFVRWRQLIADEATVAQQARDIAERVARQLQRPRPFGQCPELASADGQAVASTTRPFTEGHDSGSTH
jgi:hypothetical protein